METIRENQSVTLKNEYTEVVATTEFTNKVTLHPELSFSGKLGKDKIYLNSHRNDTTGLLWFDYIPDDIVPTHHRLDILDGRVVWSLFENNSAGKPCLVYVYVFTISDEGGFVSCNRMTRHLESLHGFKNLGLHNKIGR